MDAFVKDTIQSGGNPKLVQKLVEKSREALDWLKRQDNELDLSVVSQCGGHSFPRTFRCPPTPDGRPLPVGWRLVQALQKRLQTLPNVKVVTQSPVAELVLRNQKVAGVKTKQEEQPSNAIVLASGGFAGKLDSWLMRQYAPDLVHLATTNGPWATGDGVRLGLAAGAAVRDMVIDTHTLCYIVAPPHYYWQDQVQIHPTGFIDLTDPNNPTKFLAPESLRAYGAILLDAKVHRFANELAQRDVLTRAIFDSTASTGSPYQLPACTTAAYLVINDAMASQFGMETLEFYIHKDFFIQCQGIQGLAEYLRVDSENLRKEFEVYDDCAQHKKSDPFGKTVFPRPILAGASHFWVALVTPCVHYTMGGLKINEEAQVIASETDQPIPGASDAEEGNV